MLLLTVAVLDGACALVNVADVVLTVNSLCWCCPFLYAWLSALLSLYVNSVFPSVAVVLIVITVADPTAAFNLASILMLLDVYGYVSSDS